MAGRTDVMDRFAADTARTERWTAPAEPVAPVAPRRAGVAVPVVVITLALAMVAATVAAVVIQDRLAAASHPEAVSSLDAHAIALPGGSALGAAASAAGAAPTVPGSSRLALLGPVGLLDTRGAAKLAPGATATLALPNLPPNSTGVLVEVSVLDATGPGAVTLHSTAGDVVALRVARAGAQQSATTVTLIGPDGALRATLEGGGHLVATLVGAFVAADTATAGRIVPLPPSELYKLVPAEDGKDEDLDLASVPALRAAGPVAGILLSVSADVGAHGGLMAAGPAADRLGQWAFWSATSGTDRTRYAFMVVPVTGPRLHLHYEAGTEMRADLVGYVTDGRAPRSGAGLIVPRPPRPVGPVHVAAGATADVDLVGRDGAGGVPADHIAAALLGLSATGDGVGPVSLNAPAGPAPLRPTLIAAPGAARGAVAVVPTDTGTVRVASDAGAAVTLTPQALILK